MYLIIGGGWWTIVTRSLWRDDATIATIRSIHSEEGR
jgi:hypothetical protein